MVFARGSSSPSRSINPAGKAVAVDGGDRVSGCWTYGSLIGQSHWTVGNSVVHDGGLSAKPTGRACRRSADGFKATTQTDLVIFSVVPSCYRLRLDSAAALISTG
jgi:hypothetical protein